MSAGGSCGSLRKAGHGRPQAVRFHCRVLSVHVGVCAPDRDEDTQDFWVFKVRLILSKKWSDLISLRQKVDKSRLKNLWAKRYTSSL